MFIIYLTLNLMAFYGIMGVYITPTLVVASVLSGFFYGALLEIARLGDCAASNLMVSTHNVA